MRRFHFLSLLVFLFSNGCAPANSYQEGTPQALPLEPVTVVTEGGDHTFQVQIAATMEQQQTGLMFRTGMAAGEGMLFTYKYPTAAGFWMRNTFIPLDIIFIRGDGTIANIAHNTTPLSLDTISSVGHINGVLEINGGLAEELGIEPGDRVLHPFFHPKDKE